MSNKWVKKIVGYILYYMLILVFIWVIIGLHGLLVESGLTTVKAILMESVIFTIASFMHDMKTKYANRRSGILNKKGSNNNVE